VAKKPRYPLESYLEHTRQRKEQALQELGAAEEKVREEREKHDRLEAELEKILSERDERKSRYWTDLREGKLKVTDIQAQKNYLEKVEGDGREKRREVLAHERAIKRAEKAVEEAREAFKEISNEVKIHEEKKGRWLAEIKKEEERKAQIEAEDISGAMYERRRREREAGK
jgi:hypothetical protein